MNFYPRTPCGVRLEEDGHFTEDERISIHVPRAGYDTKTMCLASWRRYFYPRTPCGVRPQHKRIVQAAAAFLSTYPVRGTTDSNGYSYGFQIISIHVPRAGYDRERQCPGAYLRDFYPRTPCGVRLAKLGTTVSTVKFLSTYPVRGTTCPGCRKSSRSLYFYPRTPCGVRPRTPQQSATAREFLSTYPVRGTTGHRCVCPRRHGISIHVPRAGYDSKV